MMKYWILGLLYSIGFTVFGQDTTMVLSLEQFYSWVAQYHPMAKQANLLTEKGKETLKAARGNFDPYLDIFYQKKEFDNKLYHEYSRNGLTIPTWMGIDLETGLDYTNKNALYTSVDDFTYVDGTGYLGVSVPLGQGLLIDYRRAELKKAKIYQQSSEIERIVLLNDLLLNATNAYWDWVESYYNLKILEQSLINSNTRFQAVKTTYLGGDMSGMDTLEAFLQVQSMSYLFNEAKVEFQNHAWLVSNFLWTEDQQPLEITTSVYPTTMDYQQNQEELAKARASVNTIIQNHPQIQLYTYKRTSLEIDRRYKADKLKPKLKLKYQLLGKGHELHSLNGFYKVGISFQFPLFLREERGNLALAKIKLQEVDLSLQQKNRELITKLETTLNKLENIDTQIQLYEDAVKNYQRLLKAEEMKVFYGESSLFKVNAREQKLLDAQQKLMQLKIKHYQTKALLAWVSGVLYVN